MPGPTPEFWQAHFDANKTPWDRREVSPQLRRWLVEGALGPCRIVVPGCGSGYEVAVLAKAGFEVTALDYAPAAIDRTRARLAQAGLPATVLEADVLEWSPVSPFDAVYEQTCLCALYPDHWTAYARKLHEWLVPGGRLFALFMQAVRPGAANGLIEGPPYHCDINAMRALFDASRWSWPAPPYERVAHPIGHAEIAAILTRR
jgi:SAM-dependent methyltransferase